MTSRFHRFAANSVFAVFILFLVVPVMGQMFESKRMHRYDWVCLTDKGEFVSGHQRWDKAKQSCEAWSIDNDFKAFHLRPSVYRFTPTAFAQNYPAPGEPTDDTGQPPANQAPVQNNPISVQCQAGIASSTSLLDFWADPDGDSMTFAFESDCTPPTGVSVSGNNVECSTGTSAGTTAGCVISADDGTADPVDSSAFSVVISDPSGLVWAAQGDPGYLPYPINRNGTGTATVSAAVGYARNWGGYELYGSQNPTIRHVTSANDSGAGTLRDRLSDHDSSGSCSVIVFDVGPTIEITSSNLSFTNDCLFINGTASPTKEIIIHGDVDVATPGLLTGRASDVLIEGVYVIVTGLPTKVLDPKTGTLTCPQAINAINIGSGADNWSLVSTTLLGGTDQIMAHGRGSNLQLIDVAFGNPSGAVFCNHNFGPLIQDSSESGIGLGVFIFNSKNRNPRSLMENMTWSGYYGYNLTNAVFDISVDKGISSPPTFKWNIYDAYYDDIGQGNNPSVIRISQSGTTAMANASEFRFERIRTDAGICSDAWDSECVTVQTNSEGNLRHNSDSNAPTGFVETNTSSLSRDDFITLTTQNNGPCPNSRPTSFQDIYDDARANTLTISDEYSYTFPSNSSSTYSLPASPHADDDSDGYPNLLEQFDDERRGCYAN